MDVDAAPQLYLHVPGVVMKAEGVSRSAARAHRASESIDGCAEANRDVRGGGAPGRSHLAGSLRDCRDNTLVPRFFALYPEPLAKGADALAQLDWGRSRCQHCGQLHRECAFAFPPRGLLAPFVAKARSDGLRGVIVVPFEPSDQAWPTLAAASRTSVVGQRDPCVIVPNSREYAREGNDLGGAQRLAVMTVDFSRGSRRSFEGVAAPCASIAAAHDAGDRRRVAEALLRLGRPGHKRPRADRGW
jgi:hypothetical protein